MIGVKVAYERCIISFGSSSVMFVTFPPIFENLPKPISSLREKKASNK